MSAIPMMQGPGLAGPRRAFSPGAPQVDLGHEPALSREGEQGQHDRRSVSVRWLAGTILTGLFGATLIGSAIYVSLDGELTFAERGELAVTPAQRSAASGDRSPRGGDKLFVAADVVSAKQAFKTPTTIKVGDREVIKVKPFVRVATNLALGSLGFSDDVPPFNPMKLYGGADIAADKAAPELEITDGDAEVSVQRRPLMGYDAPDEPGAVLSAEQAAAQVAEEQRAMREAGQRAPLAIAGQRMLSMAMTAPKLQPDPAAAPAPGISFSTMQVTFVPENVTTKAKTPAAAREAAPAQDERMVTVKRGETFEQTLWANGATPAEIKSLTTALAARLKDAPVKEGQRLKLLFGPALKGGAAPLLRVMVYDGETITAIGALDDRNNFVSVAPPQADTPVVAEDEEETDDKPGGIRLYDSLYETAFKHDIPKAVVDQLVKITFYDYDLQRRVSGGDSFEVFYSEDEENDGKPEVLYAALNVGGQQKRYYRFQLGDENVVDFFDEQGKSNRKFLLRKPISEGVLRSTFGMRYHPILRYSRMHNGVDWANKVGTPILAAGDGKVRLAGWESGYGRRVEIEHSYGFVTTYNHMSGFGKGIKEGVRVRQGQVIGYLGSTGLSTGPHLHYEVMINENLVDPLTIKLPRNRELDAGQLASFQRERDRINELMRKAPSATRLAERAQR